jgi:hypothetical protein
MNVETANCGMNCPRQSGHDGPHPVWLPVFVTVAPMMSTIHMPTVDATARGLIVFSAAIVNHLAAGAIALDAPLGFRGSEFILTTPPFVLLLGQCYQPSSLLDHHLLGESAEYSGREYRNFDSSFALR